MMKNKMLAISSKHKKPRVILIVSAFDWLILIASASASDWLIVIVSAFGWLIVIASVSDGLKTAFSPAMVRSSDQESIEKRFSLLLSLSHLVSKEMF